MALDWCIKQAEVIINICIKYNITHNVDLITNIESKVIKFKDVDTDTVQNNCLLEYHRLNLVADWRIL